MNVYRDEVDEDRINDYYDDEEGEDEYDEELDPEARKELANILGKYRS